MRTRSILIPAILIAVAIGAYIGYSKFTQKTATAAEHAADLTVEAKALYEAFVQDEATANKQYNDKVVQVNGTVRDIATETDGRTTVTLDSGDPIGGVVCEFAAGEKVTLEKNAPASIKGFCAGYNLDVLLQRCSTAR
jgi:hypothetical protein